jgi:hypothetical protein
MSSSSDSVTFSNLNANCKRVHNRLAVWAVSTVGFSIQERKTMPSHELNRQSQSDFNSLIDTCDLVILCSQGGFRADVPLAHEIVAIKRLVKQFYNTNVEKVNGIIRLLYFTLYYILLMEDCCVVCIVACLIGLEEVDRDETSVSQHLRSKLHQGQWFYRRRCHSQLLQTPLGIQEE